QHGGAFDVHSSPMTAQSRAPSSASSGQRQRKSPQSLHKHFVIDAHANANVIGRLKKTARDGGSLVGCAQTRQKTCDIATFQVQERGGAEPCAHGADFGLGIEKRSE